MAHLLVVEDDPTIRKNLERYLTSEGFEVTAARGGREALDLIEEVAFDLVVTDLNMPDIDGMEVVIAIRKLERPLPVLAISGGGMFPREMLLDTAAGLGATKTLEKPFDLSELGDAIRELIGR